jgi:hypothetical protein
MDATRNEEARKARGSRKRWQREECKLDSGWTENNGHLESKNGNGVKQSTHRVIITIISVFNVCYFEISHRVYQYSVWLWTGRPSDLGSIPFRGKRIFLLACVSRPALGPTQPPIKCVPGGLFPRANAAGAWRWPLTPIKCWGREWVGAILSLPPSASMACSGARPFHGSRG